ncbi:MAG: cytochrome bc complex cytochrome b subunit [Anaerolineales bacterium]|nr:MAG: cytochrome bc complex cytochrome b subunit [Anaerolineales bacterium]
MQTQKSVAWRVWDWLDGRYKLASLMDALLHVEIPRSARTFYFGGITLFFFIVQAITGILLSLYYQPSPDRAYDSILFIMNEVNFGWLIRSVHSWGANLMILFCVLHLLRIFFQGAYKAPREITWLVGGLLLGVTLGFGFTGYLLPWDQRAFWATTVGSEIAGAVPLVGKTLLVVLRGGAEVTARTLSRFFGIHVLAMPAALLALLAIHLTFVHQQGLADPSAEAAPQGDMAPVPESGQEKKKLLPFFPHYVLDEVIAWYVMLAALIVLASLFPAGLEEPADPLRTPEHAKPEWYFLFLYQGLKVVPRIVGVTVPIVGGVVLLLLPFVDRNPHLAPAKRPIAIAIGVVSLIGIIAFTIWGWLS